MARNKTEMHVTTSQTKLLYPKLSYLIRGAVFAVYKTLGQYHEEPVYANTLAEELGKRKIPFNREKAINVIYKNKKVGIYRPDFVIDDKIIIELKKVEFLPRNNEKQLSYYLGGTSYRLGFLVNFGSRKGVDIRRRIVGYGGKMNNMFSFRVILLISVLFSAITLVKATTVKGEIFSLGISPPLLEVMIMPGKSIIQAYQLENSGDETIINTQILPFEPEGEHGNIRLKGGSTSREVEPPRVWFNFENADISLGKPFTLKAGETKQVLLKIKIPENTPEDDYYFTFLFSSKPKERIAGSASLEAGVIGTNILLTVSRTGKPVKKGEIVEFSTQRFCFLFSVFCFPILDSFDKPEFLLRVKNTGRAFWKPFGKIKVEGILGQKYEQELLPDNVLANSTRQISVATESASPSFLIGPFQAKVEFALEEDGQGPSLSSTTSFLALPIKVLVGVLTGLVILFTIKTVILKKIRT